MFLAIFSIMILILVYDIFQDIIPYYMVLLGMGAGWIVGYWVGRIANFSWHEEKSVVIARMDRVGIFFIVLYTAFSISRRWIFGHWIHGPMLTAFSFSTVAGIMLGRLMSTRSKIKGVLREQGKLKKN